MNTIRIKHEIANLFIPLIISILFFSCKTNEVTEQPQVTQEETKSEAESIISEEPEIIVSEIIEEPIVIEETKQDNEIEQAYKEEYSRSVGDVKDIEIPMKTFIEDKESVLSIIENLYIIMEKKEYKRWLNYISPESLEYWQKPGNLKAVSSRLPVKGYTLKSLEDYFRMIFIPSRIGIIVHEIRYITPEKVKVVQVKDNHDIICYYFEKVDNKWMLVLDTLE